MIGEPEQKTWVMTSFHYSWNSDSGFVYDKCKHRAAGACLRCRLRWLINLWRNGNHVWYLP